MAKWCDCDSVDLASEWWKVMVQRSTGYGVLLWSLQMVSLFVFVFVERMRCFWYVIFRKKKGKK